MQKISTFFAPVSKAPVTSNEAEAAAEPEPANATSYPAPAQGVEPCQVTVSILVGVIVIV